MLTNAIMTAALGSRNVSPSVLPSPAGSSWQLPVSITISTAGGFGFAHGTSSHDATLMVIKPARTQGADTRVATEQDRPPRGEPR